MPTKFLSKFYPSEDQQKSFINSFGCLLASYSDVNNFDDIMSSSTLISYALTER